MAVPKEMLGETVVIALRIDQAELIGPFPEALLKDPDTAVDLPLPERPATRMLCPRGLISTGTLPLANQAAQRQRVPLEKES